MLSLAEIKPIAEELLKKHLPIGGLTSTSIVLRPDSFGDPSIFVVAEVADEAFPSARREHFAVVAEIRAALVDRDEDRFPFLEITSPSDRAEAAREDAA